jgi:hypothetical protein
MVRTRKHRDRIIIIGIPLIMSIPLLAFIIYGIFTYQKNPAERNYLYFPNTNIETIRDSIHSFMEIMYEYPIPIHERDSVIYFSYWNHLFKLNTTEIGTLSFNNLRGRVEFELLSDEQIKNFINIFLFLYDNDVVPFRYRKANESHSLALEYKPYYNMYKTWTYDDDLERWIFVSIPSGFGNVDYYKILDIYEDMFLYTYNSARIRADSAIKYEKHEELRIPKLE